jgi:hypothetical protein
MLGVNYPHSLKNGLFFFLSFFLLHRVKIRRSQTRSPPRGSSPSVGPRAVTTAEVDELHPLTHSDTERDPLQSRPPNGASPGTGPRPVTHCRGTHSLGHHHGHGQRLARPPRNPTPPRHLIRSMGRSGTRCRLLFGPPTAVSSFGPPSPTRPPTRRAWALWSRCFYGRSPILPPPGPPRENDCHHPLLAAAAASLLTFLYLPRPLLQLVLSPALLSSLLLL